MNCEQDQECPSGDGNCLFSCGLDTLSNDPTGYLDVEYAAWEQRNKE